MHTAKKFLSILLFMLLLLNSFTIGVASDVTIEPETAQESAELVEAPDEVAEAEETTEETEAAEESPAAEEASEISVEAEEETAMEAEEPAAAQSTAPAEETSDVSSDADDTEADAEETAEEAETDDATAQDVAVPLLIMTEGTTLAVNEGVTLLGATTEAEDTTENVDIDATEQRTTEEAPVEAFATQTLVNETVVNTAVVLSQSLVSSFSSTTGDVQDMEALKALIAEGNNITIKLSGFVIDEALEIGNGKNITLQIGDNVTMTASGSITVNGGSLSLTGQRYNSEIKSTENRNESMITVTSGELDMKASLNGDGYNGIQHNAALLTVEGSNTTVTLDKAGLYYGTSGGAAVSGGATLNLIQSYIGGNSSSGNGAGVLVTEGSTLYMDDAQIGMNESTNGVGGGVYLENSVLSMNGYSEIFGNYSKKGGADLSVVDSSIQAENDGKTMPDFVWYVDEEDALYDEGTRIRYNEEISGSHKTLNLALQNGAFAPPTDSAPNPRPTPTPPIIPPVNPDPDPEPSEPSDIIVNIELPEFLQNPRTGGLYTIADMGIPLAAGENKNAGECFD